MRARREVIVLAFALVSAVAPVFADRPEWVEQLPFTEDDYWGVGRGATQQEAEESARREILMQLSSRVKAVVTMELATGSGAVEASESMDAYFTGNTLRGAELVERYSEDDKHWVLMKYCDECGKALMQSALVRFEDKLGYEAGDLIEGLNDESLSRSYKIERRLGELELSDFSADDIIIRFEERMIVIMIVNFLPFDSSLNPGQLQSLDVLSASLLEELVELGYESIDVVGHANPTGDEDEIEELAAISRGRAETMAARLLAAGITVDTVSWRGGDELAGDPATDKGKGLNRRVEIVVSFE